MSRAERDMRADAGGVSHYGLWREGWEAKRGVPFTPTELANVRAVVVADLDRCQREASEVRAGKRKPGTETLPQHASVLAERIFATQPSAAQAAAMEAVARAAVAWSKATPGEDFNQNFALCQAVEAYAATLPRAHGGEGAGL